MALIKCPECGRENVSSSAESCPSCGYNIKSYYDKKIEREKTEERIRTSSTYAKPIPPASHTGWHVFFWIISAINFFGGIGFCETGKGLFIYCCFLVFPMIIIDLIFI